MMKAMTFGRRLGIQCVLLALIFAPGTSSAGNAGPFFRSIGAVEGLPDNRVEAIVQDVHGYLWIGTQSGLVRHEGDRLRLIGQDAETEGLLPGQNIMSLHAHSNGSVFAAVGGYGVIEIGPDLTALRQLRAVDGGVGLPHDAVWSMTEDCDGQLWLAFMRGGVARLDPTSGELTHFGQSEDYGLDPAGFQMEIHSARDCSLWLVQTGRVSRLMDPAQARFETVLQRDVELGDAIFHAVHELSDGQILVARRRQLLAVDVESRTAGRLLETDDVITGVLERPDGAWYVATLGGLLTWSPEQGEIGFLRRIEGVDGALPSNRLQGLFKDHEGGLWLRMSQSGIAYLSPGHAAFSRFQRIPGQNATLALQVVSSVLPLNERGVFLASRDGGAQFLDLTSGQAQWLQDYFADPQLTELDWITDMAQVGEEFFLARANRIYSYNPGQRALRQALVREQIDQGTFRFLRPAGADAVWVATFDAGLIRLGRHGEQVERFHEAGEGYHFLPETEIVALTTGPDGEWWLAGRNRVFRYQPETGFTEAVAIEQGQILAMAWFDDTLWLASDQNLQRWQSHNGQLMPTGEWTLRGRLAGGRVHALALWDQSQLWMVLSNGLARFDPERDVLTRLGADDGLPVAEFMPNGMARLGDGRLALGSARGLMIVDPAQIETSQVAPPVHIHRVQAGDRLWSLAAGGEKTVQLTYDINAISIDFTALSFFSPRQIRYRLMLEGWDQDWLEITGQTRHHYSRLRPGHYQFRVQAAAADGEWSEAGDSLILHIPRPPWLSTPALAGYALLLVLLLAWGGYLLRQQRQRRDRMRQAQRERAMAEQQRAFIEQLNRTLEPEAVAQTLIGGLLRLTGASRGWLAYLDPRLPAQPITSGQPMSLEQLAEWRARLPSNDRLLIEFPLDNQTIAECGLEWVSGPRTEPLNSRVALLIQTARPVLRNLLLVQKVKALAEQAAQASAAKSDFLATMSHEIRTPLHGVLGMVELLRAEPSSTTRSDWLETLHRSGYQLQRIIDDVLDISRIEAGRLDLVNQHFELMPVLEQVVDLHAGSAATKRLDLRLRVASDMPLSAYGDAGRLAQVLGNLLSNAVKFTAEGGIELSVDRDRAGQLAILVSDSGPGIPAADRQRLFQPFEQLDASITRAHSGSGLGLAICKRLIAAMQGDLSLLDSTSRGSRFKICLPVLPDQAPALPLCGILSGFHLHAHVDASTARVLRRLARRWGFGLSFRLEENSPACDVCLIDPALPPKPLPSCRAQVILQRPGDPADQYGAPTHAAVARLTLPWPLVESRLLALLLGQRLAPPDSGLPP